MSQMTALQIDVSVKAAIERIADQNGMALKETAAALVANFISTDPQSQREAIANRRAIIDRYTSDSAPTV